MNMKKLGAIAVAVVLGLTVISPVISVSAAELNDYQKQHFEQIESHHKNMIDQGIASGRISQDQANQMNKNFDAHMKNMKEYAANNPDSNGFGPCGGYGMMGGGYGMGKGMMGNYNNNGQGNGGYYGGRHCR